MNNENTTQHLINLNKLKGLTNNLKKDNKPVIKYQEKHY